MLTQQEEFNLLESIEFEGVSTSGFGGQEIYVKGVTGRVSQLMLLKQIAIRLPKLEIVKPEVTETLELQEVLK